MSIPDQKAKNYQYLRNGEPKGGEELVKVLERGRKMNQDRELRARCGRLQIMCAMKGNSVLLEFVVVAAQVGSSTLSSTPFPERTSGKHF